jgi:integrase
MAQNL